MMMKVILYHVLIGVQRCGIIATESSGILSSYTKGLVLVLNGSTRVNHVNMCWLMQPANWELI
jgi:hypothetical protein